MSVHGDADNVFRAEAGSGESGTACWVDTEAAPASALFILVATTSLLICAQLCRGIFFGYTSNSQRIFREQSGSLPAWHVIKTALNAALTAIVLVSMPTMLPFVIGVAICPSDKWSSNRIYCLEFGIDGFVCVLAECAIRIGCLLYTRHCTLKRLEEVEKGLPDVLKDGTIKLLSLQWLLAQPPDYIVARRQDLPEEAFVKKDDAVSLLADGRVAAISYRWIERGHPDPEGWHMQALRKFLCANHGQWQALMMDFTALPQKDEMGKRAKEEDESFKKGLKAMSAVYASPRITVLQHKALPKTRPELRTCAHAI